MVGSWEAKNGVTTTIHGPESHSWRRRRSFQTWLHRHKARQSIYHRLRWFISLLSPYNILTMVVKLIQTCAMAGQYCDTSAANGVANAAMVVATGGSGGDDHLHSQYHSSKSPYPQSSVMHTAVILSLARSWGTLCGLSFAIWSLLRGEGGGMRGSIGDPILLVMGRGSCRNVPE